MMTNLWNAAAFVRAAAALTAWPVKSGIAVLKHSYALQERHPPIGKTLHIGDTGLGDGIFFSLLPWLRVLPK
jgi:hypothetical protein